MMTKIYTYQPTHLQASVLGGFIWQPVKDVCVCI